MKLNEFLYEISEIKTDFQDWDYNGEDLEHFKKFSFKPIIDNRYGTYINIKRIELFCTDFKKDVDVCTFQYKTNELNKKEFIFWLQEIKRKLIEFGNKMLVFYSFENIHETQTSETKWDISTGAMPYINNRISTIHEKNIDSDTYIFYFSVVLI